MKNKVCILAVAMMLCCACYSQVSQSIIPSSPAAMTGGDEVRGRDGTTCRQGTHQRPTLDFGIAISSNAANSDALNPTLSDQGVTSFYQNSRNNTNVSTAYARIVIPLGDDKNRLDCTQLYSLEIQRLIQELERSKNSGSAGILVQ